jgi:histidine phosphotransfer protein HptB
MAYNPGALDASLADAVGDEPALISDLRDTFLNSARAHVCAMDNATALGDWQVAAMRLHSLAASFGARRIMDAAVAAAQVPYVDKARLAKIERAISALNA